MSGYSDRRVRGIAAWLGLAAFAGALPGATHAGTVFGARAGYADVNRDAFFGSGRIGQTPLLGLHAYLPLAPFLSVVIAGEQWSRDFRFGDASFAGLHLRGRATWTDQALYASLRAAVPGAASLYGGLGVGIHRQTADLSEVAEIPTSRDFDGLPGRATPRLRRTASAGAADPLDAFAGQVEREADRLSWHVLFGVELRPPVLPMGVFAEARGQDLEGSIPATAAAYAGVNLYVP